MLRILIADDHAVLRAGIKAIVERSYPPVEVGEAKNTPEATKLVSDEAWDCVILDLDLPGKGGLECIREIKTISPKTAILVFSGLDESEYAIRALQAGASGFLSKNAGTQHLCEAIDRIRNGGRYVSERTAMQLISRIESPASSSPHDALSPREFQVFRMIANGQTTGEIASELFISEKTVSTYRLRISEKTGLRRGAEIARYAIQHSL